MLSLAAKQQLGAPRLTGLEVSYIQFDEFAKGKQHNCLILLESGMISTIMGIVDTEVVVEV